MRFVWWRTKSQITRKYEQEKAGGGYLNDDIPA